MVEGSENGKHSTQDIDQFELLAIEHNAKDIEESEHGLIITTDPANLNEVTESLKSIGATIASSEVISRSTNLTSLNEQQEETVHQLIEQLENDEDVVAVYTSIN
jgi:transcriptional/translational regulatory protein YebC/TACO1